MDFFLRSVEGDWVALDTLCMGTNRPGGRGREGEGEREEEIEREEERERERERERRDVYVMYSVQVTQPQTAHKYS